MTLTVGTDAYDTLENVRAYWAARDATKSAAWVALADATAEMYIRQGTDWVDRARSYIGDKATAAQRLKWPRKFAEVEGFTLDDDTIPWQVKEATAIVADLYRAATVDMDGIVTNDNSAVSMEKIDVITIQYDTGRRLLGPAVPTHVFQLLRPLTLGQGGLVRA